MRSWVLVAVGLVGCTRSATPNPDAVLRIVSYNVRYGTAPDGDNRWELRKRNLVEHLRALQPDLLGTQEMMVFQSRYVETELPAYERVGVGRDDGTEAGEMTALYFRRSRFEKREEGHFWLSSTPEVPGSRGWDASLPRVASWAELYDRASGRTLFFLNTHFDAAGAEARTRSATLLRERLDGRKNVILTGDFNATPDSEPHEILTGGALADTYDATGGDVARGTYNGFGRATYEARIDWILTTLSITAATIERRTFDGRHPSDHDAITATLR